LRGRGVGYLLENFAATAATNCWGIRWQLARTLFDGMHKPGTVKITEGPLEMAGSSVIGGHNSIHGYSAEYPLFSAKFLCLVISPPSMVFLSPAAAVGCLMYVP
jgi:hypothetical protein